MSQQNLEAKRRQLARSLPPLELILRGSLFRRMRRCGKPSCHCAQGEGHPVFTVGVSLPQGRTEQVCLPAELVPVARAWIRNYQRLWRRILQLSAINRELLRQRWVEASAAQPARRRRERGAV